MDIKFVEKLCKDLGVIKKFRLNHELFGNIEMEIETPRKTSLNIISDRGIFSCYVMKKSFLHNKPVPIERITNCSQNVSFSSLDAAIDYLKKHIEIIDKNK